MLPYKTVCVCWIIYSLSNSNISSVYQIFFLWDLYVRSALLLPWKEHLSSGWWCHIEQPPLWFEGLRGESNTEKNVPLLSTLYNVLLNTSVVLVTLVLLFDSLVFQVKGKDLLNKKHPGYCLAVVLLMWEISEESRRNSNCCISEYLISGCKTSAVQLLTLSIHIYLHNTVFLKTTDMILCYFH